ncbi:MAG: Ltp family lipoprotein, partial [Oscillospiraceae bacterium]|nr:Ltp family lipoprotein [Oscillospiraceae bacterium]
ALIFTLVACGSEEKNETQEMTAVSAAAETTEKTSIQDAANQADTYLSIMAFSYQGLIDQLEFEGYTTEAATYGADHCGADWNEQAVIKAKDYLEVMPFSYSGLIHQLEYSGFTSEQATCGADNCEADWNEQAAKKAESYVSDGSASSREELISLLETAGFTDEQASYGATEAGY